MTYTSIKIEWFKKNSAVGMPPTWESTGTEIDSIMDLDFSSGTNVENGIIADEFSIKFHNTDTSRLGYGNNLINIQPQDLVKLYLGSDGTENIQLTGLVVDYSQEIGDKGRIITIKCRNRTANLLKCPLPLKVVGKNAPMNVVSALNEINSANSLGGGNQTINFVYYDTATSTYKDQDAASAASSDLTIAKTKSDGTEFPTIPEKISWYQPLGEYINNLCTNEYTGDGNYVFYIDENNNAWWQPKNSTTDYNISEGDCTSIKITRDSSKVINFLIVHCGDVPYGYGAITYVYNDYSIAQFGIQGKYKDLTHLAADLILSERTHNTSSYSTEEQLIPDSSSLSGGWNMQFQVPNGYRYTVEGTLFTEGLTVSCTTESGFNDAIYEQAICLGRQISQPIVDTLGEATWKADISLTGTLSYEKDGVVELDFPSQSWTGFYKKKLRIYDINHKIDNTGWDTTLYLKEDEPIVEEET